MTYRFEIFLSYPRRPMVMEWLDTFQPLFGQWLLEELLAKGHPIVDRQVRIFRDDQIEAGQEWPRVLREAARDSYCALAILLPSYDASPHCRAEWETFRLRGPELIVPVRFHDCENRREQIFDLSAFTATVKGTTNWMKFHNQVKKLAGHAANRIVSAPPYPTDPDANPWVALDIPDPPPGRPLLQARLS